MTRCPGRIITQDDLEGLHAKVIMTQIGAHVATWRKNLPLGRAVGNLHLIGSNSKPPASATFYDKSLVPGLDVYIDGLVTTIPAQSPLTSTQQYITHLFRAALRQLKSSKLLAYNQEHISELMRAFLKETFPKLSLFNGDPEALSPRNLRIADPSPASSAKSAPTISGLVDFEFSGIFPVTEEFTNTVENNPNDWPVQLYCVLLSELLSLDALPPALAHPDFVTPAESREGTETIRFGGNEFHQAVLLTRISQNIAPWWVKEESGLSDFTLQRTLQAVNAVRSLEETVERERRERDGGVK